MNTKRLPNFDADWPKLKAELDVIVAQKNRHKQFEKELAALIEVSTAEQKAKIRAMCQAEKLPGLTEME